MTSPLHQRIQDLYTMASGHDAEVLLCLLRICDDVPSSQWAVELSTRWRVAVSRTVAVIRRHKLNVA